jgi:hypothetical protein
MAVTEISIAQRTFAALVTGGADPTKISVPHLLALVPDALELLGKRVAAGPDCEGLQKSFAATIAAGVTDTAALSGILFDPLKAIVFPPASTVPCVFLEVYEDLVYGNMPVGAAEAIYYAQNGTVLRFRNNTDGLLNTLAGAATITANYLPSLTDGTLPLPLQYEGALIRSMVELASLKTGEGEEITLIGGRA